MTTTVRDYDLAETSKLVRGILSPFCVVETHTLWQIKGVYTSLAMMGFLHIYFKYTQPLFVQAIMAFKSLYEAKIVKIHVLGQNTDGDLKRPFKAGPGLFGGACSFSFSASPLHHHLITETFPSFCGPADRQGCHRGGRKAHWCQEGRVNDPQQGGNLGGMFSTRMLDSR